MAFQPRPFNVETVWVQAKKKQTKKLRGPDSPLYIAIWPMVYIVRVFGLAPYEFSQDRLVPSNVYLIFSVIVGALYTYIFYTVGNRIIGVKKREGAVLGETESTKVIINYIVAMYELGVAAFRRRGFTRAWNALQDYDEDVRQLGYPRKETQTVIGAWIITAISAAIWTTVNRVGMYAFAETWIYNMAYMIIYVGTSVAVYKFVAMAFFLGQRFHHLKTIAIKNLPSTSKNKNTFIISKKTIVTLHNDLMIAAEDLESMYSWSLLFWLGSLGLHIISNLYFLIVFLLVNTWENMWWPLVYCLCAWLSAYFFQLVLLHIACNYASSQECVVESSFQFLNRRLNFSAGGCFYVNLPLLCSMAGLLTTYLVILLQLPHE